VWEPCRLLAELTSQPLCSVPLTLLSRSFSFRPFQLPPLWINQRKHCRARKRHSCPFLSVVILHLNVLWRLHMELELWPLENVLGTNQASVSPGRVGRLETPVLALASVGWMLYKVAQSLKSMICQSSFPRSMTCSFTPSMAGWLSIEGQGAGVSGERHHVAWLESEMWREKVRKSDSPLVFLLCARDGARGKGARGDRAASRPEEELEPNWLLKSLIPNLESQVSAVLITLQETLIHGFRNFLQKRG
jgi:hypothetical protein